MTPRHVLLAVSKIWRKKKYLETKENVINRKLNGFDVEYELFLCVRQDYSCKCKKSCRTREINSKFNVKPFNIQISSIYCNGSRIYLFQKFLSICHIVSIYLMTLIEIKRVSMKLPTDTHRVTALNWKES